MNSNDPTEDLDQTEPLSRPEETTKDLSTGELLKPILSRQDTLDGTLKLVLSRQDTLDGRVRLVADNRHYRG